MPRFDWSTSVTLDDLPTLTITSIGAHGVEAVYSDSKWIGERHIACVVSDADRIVWGRLTDVDQNKSQCVFTPDNQTELAKLQSGRAYPQLDGYWGERAELVLNRSLVWQERSFQPTDAIWYEHGEADGSLVKGGWDHEHCGICWETISQQMAPNGVFAEPDHWVCKECYRRFVHPRSLDFIADNFE